ncbi:MAG: nitroreductase family protein, partial [Steroidobacteraceae bacterium]
MQVTDAIRSRISCRAYLKRPVPRELLTQILDLARHSPSGGNLQPWFVHVLTGGALERFVMLVRERLRSHPAGEGTEYNVYPPNLH